jgi:hypothetical protein
LRSAYERQSGGVSREAREIRLKGIELLIEFDAAIELLLAVHFGGELGELTLERLVMIATVDEGRESLGITGGQWKEGLEDCPVEPGEVERDGKWMKG